MPGLENNLFRRLLILGAAAVVARPVFAQERDAGARMERVADGVYAIIHERATDEWVNGNTGVVIGDDGVLVVDATYLPSRARADIALIRKVTDKPVKYLVITHLHRDHNGGASAYRDAFPGVSVISGADTRAFIAINREATARAAAAPNSPLRAILSAREQWLARGTDSTGRPLDPESKSALERSVRERRVELDDLSSLRVIVPEIAVFDHLEIFLGKQRIDIENRGRTHSPDDVTVYAASARVLFAGDVIDQTPLPFLGTAWPMQFGHVLRDIQAMDPAAIVPGHGPVLHDLAYPRAMFGLIEGVNGQVASMLRQGLTLDQMKTRLDSRPLRALSPAWSGTELDDAWQRMIGGLVERSWHALRGLD